jgi:hypothetical protein
LNTSEKSYLDRRLWDTCKAWLPYQSFAYSNDSNSRVHRLALRLARRKNRALRSVFYGIFWPVRSARIAYHATARLSNRSVEPCVPRVRLFFSIWWGMVRHNLSVTSILAYRLWVRGALRHANGFFQHEELVVLLNWLNSGDGASELEDKIQFETSARKAGLPVAEIVATIKNQDIVFRHANGLPEEDLFTKFGGRFGGDGCLHWEFDNTTKTWTNGDGAKDQNGLLVALIAEAPEADILIQRKYENSVFMAQLSSGGLCTLRIVTYRLPDHEPQFFRASLRMPTGGNAVDNFSMGGLGAALDDRGSFLGVSSLAAQGAPIHEHPDTGVSLHKLKLEGWDSAVQLALVAHAKLTNVPTVGWDVALTEEGPILIEANAGWGGNVFQIPASRPLGPEFSEMFLELAETKLLEEGLKI